MSESDTGPLSGLIVVDLSRALAGPHAAMMLGDLGSEVIKVERPDGGDDSRGWGPPFIEGGDATYFLAANRNKKSVTADLRAEKGRVLVEDLIRRADVLIVNFRPGVFERLGFNAERLRELNPALVVLSITGFGHDGPESGRPGYDQIAQGEAGWMAMTGPGPQEPTKVGIPVGDLLAGIQGACGVLAALFERERTGQGQTVHVSLLSALVSTHTFQGTRFLVGGEVPGITGNQHPTIAPYGSFPTADGVLQIAVGNDHHWTALCDELGWGRPAHFATNALRLENRAKLQAELELALAHDTATSWNDRLLRRGIPSGLIRNLDAVYAWDQVLSQGLVVEVDHPSGSIRLPGPAWRFGENDFAGGRRRHSAPPLLGEHNDEINSWIQASASGSGRFSPVGVDLNEGATKSDVRDFGVST